MILRNHRSSFDPGISILGQVKLQDIRLLSRSMLDLTLSAEVKCRAIYSHIPLEIAIPYNLQLECHWMRH